MPTAAPHPCGNPRCGAIVPRGVRYCDRCEPHFEQARQRADAQRRGSSSSRGYDAPWRKLREDVLARDHHLCRYCANLGLDTAATLVDHIRSKAAGGTDDVENLASCCAQCHAEKSLRHDAWYGRAADPIDRVEQFVPGWPKSRVRGAA